jgi:hypothetical protein
MPADPPIPDAAVDAFLAAEDAYRRGSYRTGRWIVVDATRAGLAAAYPILAEQWRGQGHRCVHGSWTCDHCHDDPPPGHTCPTCGRHSDSATAR